MFRYLFTVFLGFFLIAGCNPFSSDKPNIILIFSDDAGYSDFGFQGNTTYKTPNMDRIAEKGVRFSNAYVTASVCSPSRAGLLTGRYQQRFGHEFNLPGMEDADVTDAMRGLPLTEITIADLLKENGYSTGIIGKWHLGTHENFHPSKRGFDEFFGMLGGSSKYQAGSATNITSNYKEVDNTQLPYLTDAFGNEAVDFIKRHQDDPFFLYLSFNAPHTPMEAKKEYFDQFKQKFNTDVRAANAAMTLSLDENVGKVMETLSELDLMDNTIIIFTNDNGGAMPYNGSSNSPVRGTKGTVLEGGIHVPMLIQWNEHINPGTVYDHPVSTLDLLPTLVAAASGSLPNDREYDGVNLMPYLSGVNKTKPHKMLFWKLNWAAAIRKGDWKLIRTPDDEMWLFNVERDLIESINLYDREPIVVSDLLSELSYWERNLPPPIWVSDPKWRAHSLERYNQEKVNTFKRY